MKKTKLFILVLALFVLFGCFESKEKVEKKSFSDSQIALNYAPENSIALWKFSSIDKLFKTFAVTDSSIFGETTTSKEDLSEFEKVIGFNPMILADYEKIGIDTGKEFGFVLTDLIVNETEGSKTQANFGILFPIKTDVNAYDFFKEKVFANKSDEFIPTEVGNIITIKSSKDEEVLVTVSHDDSYLIFNISINMNGTVKKFIDKNGKLGAVANYKEIKSSVDLGADIAFYMDFKQLLKHNDNLFEALNSQLQAQGGINQMGYGSTEPLKYYRGVGATLDLESSDLIANIVGFVDKNSPFLEIMQNAKADKSVMLNFEQKPAILLAILVNFEKYIEFMLETMPQETKAQFDKALLETKTNMGIDIDQELIKQLAGSFNFGIYDANTINMMNYNTVINFNVKSPTEFTKTLEKGASLGLMAMDEQGLIDAVGSENKDLVVGVKGYSISLGMMMGYVIMKGDNVSIVSGKPTLIQLLQGNSSKSFTNKLDGEIAGKLNKDDNYFYLDIVEAYKITKTVYGMIAGMTGAENQIDAKTDAFVKNFVYLYGQGSLDGEKGTGEYVLKTTFNKPFFLALQEEIDKLDLTK
ncbi:MAG: hypothetical protein GQ534_00250 [Candidatus Delongbacteria bacterium]|nr:hypothetical protein [Candidatus Delongbacteria bacterium]